jgi:hypothetical protein
MQVKNWEFWKLFYKKVVGAEVYMWKTEHYDNLSKKHSYAKNVLGSEEYKRKNK